MHSSPFKKRIWLLCIHALMKMWATAKKKKTFEIGKTSKEILVLENEFQNDNFKKLGNYFLWADLLHLLTSISLLNAVVKNFAAFIHSTRTVHSSFFFSQKNYYKWQRLAS